VSVVARLVAFAVILVAVFAGGWAAGAAVGPFDDDTEPAPAHVEHEP
jgi:hypothetical protein